MLKKRNFLSLLIGVFAQGVPNGSLGLFPKDIIYSTLIQHKNMLMSSL